MSHKSFPEKRRAIRVDNNVPVKISAQDVDFVTETRNISASGAYCKVNKFIEPMTKLMILLLLPVRKGPKVTTKKIACSGVVVRCENILHEEGFHVAIFFSDLQPKDSKALHDFVNGAVSAQTNNAV